MSGDETKIESDFLEQAKFFSDRQIYRRRPKKAGDVINKLMARTGYNQNEAILNLQSDWESVLSDKLRTKSRVLKIRRGCLEVIVSSSILNQEFNFQKKQLIRKMNQTPTGKSIKDIRFQVGEV